MALLLVFYAQETFRGYLTLEDEWERQHEEERDQTRRAADEIADRCRVPNLPPAIINNCLTGELNRYIAEDHSDQDLQAQVDMAYWARSLFWLTAGTAIISLGGLVALIASLRQTRHAINDNKRSVEATIEANRIAQAANAVDQRPWLHVEITKITDVSLRSTKVGDDILAQSVGAIIHVGIKNTGRTPARSVSVLVEACGDFDAHKVIDRIGQPSATNGFLLLGVVPPNAEIEQDYPVSRSLADTPKKLDFEFVTRLVCAVVYDERANRLEKPAFRTVQTFIIEGNNERRTSGWINTHAVRNAHLTYSVRAAAGDMT